MGMQVNGRNQIASTAHHSLEPILPMMLPRNDAFAKKGELNIKVGHVEQVGHANS